MFKLQTEVSRLKSDVQKLGSARDTVELRQKVGAAIQRIQSSAQDIKGRLMKLHNESKTPQTTKIVNDFEVRAYFACLNKLKIIYLSSAAAQSEFTIVASAKAGCDVGQVIVSAANTPVMKLPS